MNYIILPKKQEKERLFEGIMRKISETYPELREECESQIESKKYIRQEWFPHFLKTKTERRKQYDRITKRKQFKTGSRKERIYP